MSVTVDQLKKTGASNTQFDLFVREQIGLIDDRLVRHDRRWGRNVVPYELPTHYMAPGLTAKDVQRILYSTLIQHYKDGGFEVRLLLEPERPYMLYLAWTTDLTKEQIDAMNAVISKARIALGDLDAFCSSDALAETAEPAPPGPPGPHAPHAPPGPPGHPGPSRRSAEAGGRQPN
jgi:hypothetical protein